MLVRVLIADDHAGFRTGLGRLLEREAAVEVAGFAADGEEAVAAAERLRPDVALLDVRMPALDGVEACRRIRASWPDVAVLLITGTPDEGIRLRAAEAGAAGVLQKDESPAAIAAALLAAAGRRFG